MCRLCTALLIVDNSGTKPAPSGDWWYRSATAVRLKSLRFQFWDPPHPSCQALHSWPSEPIGAEAARGISKPPLKNCWRRTRRKRLWRRAPERWAQNWTAFLVLKDKQWILIVKLRQHGYNKTSNLSFLSIVSSWINYGSSSLRLGWFKLNAEKETSCCFFLLLKRIMTSNGLPLLKGNYCRRAVCFLVLSLKEQNKSFTAFSAVTARVRTVVFIMRPARTQAAAAAAGRHGTPQQQTLVVLLGCLPSVLLPSWLILADATVIYCRTYAESENVFFEVWLTCFLSGVDPVRGTVKFVFLYNQKFSIVKTFTSDRLSRKKKCRSPFSYST